MPARKTGQLRTYRMTLYNTKIEDEYVARKSWDMGMSKGGLMRYETFPRSTLEMAVELEELRKKQKGIRGILRPERA